MTHSTLRKKSPRRSRKTMSTGTEHGPRESTLQFSLGYSRALQVVDAPPVGKVDVILN